MNRLYDIFVFVDGIFTALPEADLSIECTLNEVTALYTYNGRGLSDINDYGFAWICVVRLIA